MLYTPDRWIVVHIQSLESPHFRVFAGWYGGFTHGDSWKMNSGITKVDEYQEYYDFHGYSGSVYRCYKNLEGMSLYMHSVLSSMQRDNTTFSITQADVKDIVEIKE